MTIRERNVPKRLVVIRIAVLYHRGNGARILSHEAARFSQLPAERVRDRELGINTLGRINGTKRMLRTRVRQRRESLADAHLMSNVHLRELSHATEIHPHCAGRFVDRLRLANISFAACEMSLHTFNAAQITRRHVFPEGRVRRSHSIVCTSISFPIVVMPRGSHHANGLHARVVR